MLGLSGRAAGPGLPMYLPRDVASSAGWRRIGRGNELSSSGPHPASRLRGPMGAKAPKGRIGSLRRTRSEHARESTEPGELGASTAAEPTGVRGSRRGEQGRRECHLARPEGRESSPWSLSKLPAPEANDGRTCRGGIIEQAEEGCVRRVVRARDGDAARGPRRSRHPWQERARASPIRSALTFALVGESTASQIERGKSPGGAPERLNVKRQKEPLGVEIAQSS